ncbi:SGNH hydrolase-type esterase domain-containing protein [Bisporella sp. PMI_857]|nr:SGNH hydrolase-type esterase domain-containing protein [Bisporella sp. PMI_857]
MLYPSLLVLLVSTVTSARLGPRANPSIRLLGRVNPATQELTWPGTGVSFTFTGSKANIAITSIIGDNSIDLAIDGGAPAVISHVNGTSISTPAGLSQGTHTVVLRKRSEAGLGTFSIGAVTANGPFITDIAPTRRIEIVGDSISVGYGLDGTLPCVNTAALEDNPKTYGAIAAQALGADYSVVAWSGKGLVRNYATGSPDSSPLMPQLYTRYGANDADGSYSFPSSLTPQAVVINLGTNDWSYLNARSPIDPTVFTAAMVKFIRDIQKYYPNAYFFLLSSPMLSDTYPTAADKQKTTQTNALKAAISQLGSSKVQFVDWPTQGSDVGCDYHPNAATNAAEGKVLAAAIRAALGW